MTTKKQILIIDDETSILQTLASSLEDEGHIVQTLNNGKNALDVIGTMTPDVVLLDISMPGCNGLELLTLIKKNYPQQHVIMISGYGTIPVAIEALRNGAADFIEKPFNLDDVLAKIDALVPSSINQSHIQAQVNDFNATGIQGSSSLFCELMHHVTLIAPLNIPLVIYGPHGSGKTLIARYIHSKSNQKDLQYLEFNCATQTELPDLLFSHKGSVIIKNIDQLLPENQRRLLHILEKNDTPRIIATALPKLFKMVQQGLFNASLFCKLSSTPCEIPPLNKRRYDIPFLINHFVTTFNLEHKKSIVLTSDAIRKLRNHTWAGDIAELKNTLTAILATSTSSVIDAQRILLSLPERTSQIIDEQMYARFNSLDQATEVFQRSYLNHLLKRHNYNTLQLAEFLQIPIAQLTTTMTKLQINT